MKHTLFLLLMLISPMALAQPAPEPGAPVDESVAVTTIANLEKVFRTITADWTDAIEKHASSLLFLLGSIALAWQAIQAVLRGTDLNELVTLIVTWVMVMGLFLWLINNAATYTELVINSFVQVASDANRGESRNFSAAAVMSQGFDLSAKIRAVSAGWVDTALLFIVAIIAIFIYAVIAAYVLLVYAEAYLVLTAGILLLGFGALSWTQDIAKRYLMYVISVGAKMYALFLVIGIADTYIANMIEAGDVSKGTVLPVIGILFLQMMLVTMLPNMVQGMINGSTIGSGGPALTGMMIAATQQAFSMAKGVASGSINAGLALKEGASLAGQQLGPNAGAGAKAGQAVKNLVGAAVKSGLSGDSGSTARGQMRSERMDLMNKAAEAALQPKGAGNE